MPIYIYEAINPKGDIIRGDVEAWDETSARLKLKKDIPFPIKRIYRKTFIRDFFDLGPAISLQQLAVFTRELHYMLQAGLPAIQCFKTILGSDVKSRFKKIIQQIIDNLTKGASFYTAFSQYPAVFSTMYLAMIWAGHISGNLDLMIGRLADHLEWEYNLRARVKAAMIYPIIVFTFSILLVIAMVLFVFPVFIGMFEGLNVPMPLLTRILIAIVGFFRHWAVVLSLVTGTIFAAYFYKNYINTYIGRQHLHWQLLKLPLIGPVTAKIAISRFCRTFSTLYASGVPILTTLEVASNATGNEIFNNKLKDSMESIKKGATLTQAIKDTEIFPGLVVSMMEVGENTGTIDTILKKVSSYYEFEVENSLSQLSQIIEPIMIFGMGILVAIITMAVFQPVYQLINGFAGQP